MIIKNIELKNFRNYESLKLSLNPKINIIYGQNGAGKTNILESIYVLSLGKSHRSFLDDTLIKSGQEKALIKGKIQNIIPYNLEIEITKTKKQLKKDDKIVTKLGEYIEKMNIIIFHTDDLELIKSSPSVRRKYLDLELSQISKNYYNTLSDYNKLLKLRNDYLKQMSEGKKIDKNYFDILTSYLIEKSVFIYQMRNKYIDKLNKICPAIFKDLTQKENFKIEYLPSIRIEEKTVEKIREKIKENFINNLQKEIQNHATLYGPHRDDFLFTLNGNNLKNFGSQGQQRIAVITLKLSEISLFEDYKKTSPIILLDDVFSELDAEKKNNLLSYIDKDMQVIITSTDLNNIDKKITAKAKLIEISKGQIIKEVR